MPPVTSDVSEGDPVERASRCRSGASVTDAAGRFGRAPRLVPTASDQLGLLRLVADLGSRLAIVEAGDLADAIVDGLQQVAEELRLDRAILWRKAADEADAVASHYWIRHADLPLPELLQLAGTRFIASNLEAGEVACFTRIDDVTDAVDREVFRRNGFRSAAVVPVAWVDSAVGVRGALVFGSATEHEWGPAIVGLLRLVSGVISQALSRQAALQAFEGTLGELHQLREDAAGEVVEDRAVVKVFRSTRLIVSEAPAIRRALVQVEQVAATPSTVLLLGETGVGKELFAQAIHELSARRSRQMIRVSCAAIPSALIESELFGHERGAYTGAVSRQIGRFEAAHHSTLFLDEIGELSAEVQVKLLRVLQERVIERLGSAQSIDVDVRIIAATNRNLEKAVEDGIFREDLYYRLNVFPIVVPPLRERVEDIPVLAWEFIHEFARTLGKRIDTISKDSMRQLQRYSWPGNVRELRNVIERAVIIAKGPHLTVPIPQPSFFRQSTASSTPRHLEIEHLRATLETTKWRIRGPMGAAERLGVRPSTLEARVIQLGLSRTKCRLDA